MSSEISVIAEKIGHRFKRPELLALALTHPSCEDPAGSNQRLEFLGDAVLDLLIAELLYQHYTDVEEGDLDHMRAHLVNGKNLATMARNLGLGKALRVSSAQRTHLPEPSDSMLEDALEAVIGAVFLDAGLGAARSVVLAAFGPALAGAADATADANPKGRLQEWSQVNFSGAVPEYYFIAESGPEHARAFTIGVRVGGEEAGQGEGSSKKSAETAAARTALAHLGI